MPAFVGTDAQKDGLGHRVTHPRPKGRDFPHTGQSVLNAFTDSRLMVWFMWHTITIDQKRGHKASIPT